MPSQSCSSSPSILLERDSHGTSVLLGPRPPWPALQVASCSLKSNLSKQPREYYSRKVLLGKARLAMVYATKVTCRVKDT
jgi:hypothetical protein